MSKKVLDTSKIQNELSQSSFFKKRELSPTPESQTQSRTTDVTNRRHSVTSHKKLVKQREKQIQLEESIDHIDAKLLSTIIQSIENARVGRIGNIPVRMTDKEKHAMEEFIELLVGQGIAHNKFSISKLMRICTRYMIKYHGTQLQDEILKEINSQKSDLN